MTYWRLFYHVVWATKLRQPLITPAIRLPLYNYLAAQANARSIVCHAVGGIEDHVHLALSIPPKLAVSQVIRELKGSSAHYINHTFIDHSPFYWQAEYGVLSFGERNLPRVIGYIQRQPEHHQRGDLIHALERIGK